MKRSKQPRKSKQKNESSMNGVKSTNGHSNGNGLTEKQKAFVSEYLIDLNASQAAIRAGYSKQTAGVTGCNNLKNDKIREAIAHEMELRAERTKVSQDKVVKELARLAFSNMKSFLKWNSNTVTMIDSDSLTEDDAACVMEVSQTTTQTGGTVRFKLYNKKEALELLGRHLGMFSDTIKHVGEGGGPVAHKFNFDDKTIKDAFDKLYGLTEKNPKTEKNPNKKG